MGKNERIAAKDSNQIAREYWDDMLVEMRLLGGTEPDCGVELFGRHFDTPIMSAPICNVSAPDGTDGMEVLARGLHSLNALTFVGMMSDAEFAAVAGNTDSIVRIIKPYADEERIFTEIRVAEEQGALAVGMDIEHAFHNVGETRMKARTIHDIERYCKSTKLPFIVKGILSAADARNCLEAGVSGLYVSNHHGILPSAVPAAMILPEIADIADGKVPIFMDGAVSNGMDAFKALALGASAVNIGYPMFYAVKDSGEAGVVSLTEAVTEELKQAMRFTGSRNVRTIDQSVLAWRYKYEYM